MQQDILAERAQLIDTVDPWVLDRIASTSRLTRERAIYALSSSLNPASEKDQIIFQTIPLELLERNDLFWAIWYIETIGKMGNAVSSEVLEKVCIQTLDARSRCMENWDEESIETLDLSMRALFRMIKKHPDLSQNQEILMFEWKFEEERGNLYGAISIYENGTQTWNSDAYRLTAQSYEKLGHLDMTCNVLEVGYQLTGDIWLLKNLIRANYKQGKHNHAFWLYSELGRCAPRDTIEPFIFYKECIESDGDIEELELMLASYLTEWTFIPSESLSLLSHEASIYIAEHIQRANSIIERLNRKSLEHYTKEEREEYLGSMFQRLWYMQIDLLTLGNARYLENYLNDIRRIGFWDLQMLQWLLADFFIEHFSLEVIHQMKNLWGIQNWLEIEAILDTDSNQDTRERWDAQNRSIEEATTVHQKISLHIARIWELFSQPGFYDIQANQIGSLLEQSAIREWEIDDEMEADLSYGLRALKDQEDYYFALRPSIRSHYEQFLKNIDKKYGAFYRRHMQNLAIDPNISSQEYPKVLQEYPDIALLFWVEKIIAWQFLIDDLEEIENIVQEYSLDQVSALYALIFGSFIFDISVEYSIGYLAEYPNMLDNPEAIYIITEWLRLIDKKSRKMIIKDLNALIKESYGARGFFEHIRRTFSDIYGGDPSDEDIESMLLSSGNLVILQNKERTQAILNFQTAWEEYSSIGWLMQAGDSYEDMWNYDQALDLFERALLQDESIESLIKVLNCTFSSGNLSKAEQYIQYGMRKQYSVWNYILAFHLWQWNVRSALLQMIQMIKEKQGTVDTPKWLPSILIDTLEYVMWMPDSLGQESDILKIYASFILCNMAENQASIEYRQHWQYICSLVDSYEGECLHTLIEEALGPITWWMGENDNKNKASSDKSIEYLDTYAKAIYSTYEKILCETEDREEWRAVRTRMNDVCWLTIMTLRKFPDSEKYVAEWGSRLQFTAPIGGTWATHIVEYTMNYQ